jgi:hypothetical protein
MKRPAAAQGVGQGRKQVAEGVGFEPTVPFGTPVFETGTFGHSVTPPGVSHYSSVVGLERIDSKARGWVRPGDPGGFRLDG